MRPVKIIGGGLAGLALGIGLRQAGVAVTLHEAGHYPRHRVCGEFLSGAGQEVLATLGAQDALTGACRNSTTAWFVGDRLLLSRALPVPAYGLSRFTLDHRLADRFEAIGGKMKTRRPMREAAAVEGAVWATGRRRGNGGLIGLKVHCRNLAQEQDLSMHLGSHGYVGVSRIEDGKSNVCGLFRKRRELSPGRHEMMDAYLRANGLRRLADALKEAAVDDGSIIATAASDFSRRHWTSDAICIGDSYTAIPPFAGNGMSMALESAGLALPYLQAYASGAASWDVTCAGVRQALATRFRLRLAMSRALHPFLVQPRGRRPLQWAVAANLLPFPFLFRVLR